MTTTTTPRYLRGGHIRKLPVSIHRDTFALELFAATRLLAFGRQGGAFLLWVWEPPEGLRGAVPLVTRRFLLARTDQRLPDEPLVYVGYALSVDGASAYYLLERTAPA